jgi:hypothetical protein
MSADSPTLQHWQNTIAGSGFGSVLEDGVQYGLHVPLMHGVTDEKENPDQRQYSATTLVTARDHQTSRV